MSLEPFAVDPVARALLDATPTGLIALTADGRVSVLNAAAYELLGLTRVAPGTALETLAQTAARVDAADRARLARLLAGNPGDKTGSATVATIEGRALTIDHRAHAAAAIVAVTPVADPAAHRTDPLTGLADRLRLHDRLQFLCAASRPAAVLLIDLDRFKHVNDSLGHPAGDALLHLVAQRLRSTLRQADVIARIGGDEFAVVMESTERVTDVATRLISVLSRPYLVDRHSAVIGASIGVAIAPGHGNDPQSLIRAADLALYQAKSDGRGVVRVFDEGLDRRARTRSVLADELRRAIPLKQLAVYFQPQVALRDRTLIGFEALVRWNHPEHGLLGPDHFIPMAEETGLILPLGEWVLSEACRQAASWPGDYSVAVNVSPKQLQDRERLPREIAAALVRTSLPPQRLEIEITESALIVDSDALDVLTRIHAMGVRISMDDFGTGYSSLSQLRSFPFDKLKIDRSFVRDLAGKEDAVAVVRAVAALGQSLGMATIAEGVETIDQEILCRDHGCTEMQGYLASRPVPGTEVHDLIQSFSQPLQEQK